MFGAGVCGFAAGTAGPRKPIFLLGSFADAHLDRLDDAQLGAFEDLLMENDGDIYDWVSGRKPVPETHETPVMELLRAHRVSDWLVAPAGKDATADTADTPDTNDTAGGGR